MGESHRFLGRARERVRRFIEALNGTATLQFVAIVLAVVWFGTVVLAHSDYRSFDSICNFDPGAALRTDEVMSQGFRPSVDFFYYTGCCRWP